MSDPLTELIRFDRLIQFFPNYEHPYVTLRLPVPLRPLPTLSLPTPSQKSAFPYPVAPKQTFLLHDQTMQNCPPPPLYAFVTTNL